MAKLAVLFVAVLFCFVQLSLSARIEKRDVAEVATEITTESFFASVKSGIKKTFSDDNINAAKDKLGEYGTKAKEWTSTAYSNVEAGVTNLLKKNDASTPAPVPAPAAAA